MAEITKIDLPVGRLPTGAVQFGADWPGVFIRGDEALIFAREIEYYETCIRDGSLPADQKNGPLIRLLALLRSCSVRSTA